MSLAMHLKKSGSGMSSMTACGRNIVRTPMSTNWEGFKSTYKRCEKCEQSKLFAFLTRQDVEQWEPVEDENAWKSADDALISARKAK